MTCETQSPNKGLPLDRLHTFPPRRIGNHEWCLCIVPSLWEPDARATRFFWRGMPDSLGERWWRDQQQWPGYDINDGMSLGLPKSLSRYFHDIGKATVQHWIDHGHAPVLPQLDMFSALSPAP